MVFRGWFDVFLFRRARGRMGFDGEVMAAVVVGELVDGLIEVQASRQLLCTTTRAAFDDADARMPSPFLFIVCFMFALCLIG